MALLVSIFSLQLDFVSFSWWILIELKIFSNVIVVNDRAKNLCSHSSFLFQVMEMNFTFEILLSNLSKLGAVSAGHHV